MIIAVVAAYEAPLARMEFKMERLDASMTLIQWQLAVLIAGVASLVAKAFL